MKLTNKELKEIVENVINNLSEDNFQLDLEALFIVVLMI